MTTLPHRFRALILLLLFVGGGTSLPALDVLLFHLHGERSRTTAHVEPAGGCTSHDGHCGVGCPATASGALGAVATASLVDETTPPVAPRSPAQFPKPHAHGFGFHSRAPPILQV